MPITRRKKINPPPENPVDHTDNQVGQNNDMAPVEPPVAAPGEGEETPSEPAHEDTTPIASANGAALPNGGLERSEYVAPVEGVKRTSFRRPSQVPATPPPAPAPQAPALPAPASYQAPTHEIALPLGNLLHLAYNPGYTGADEARSLLLHRLEHESKSGGRARCWNCGSIAIAYDCWNTRNRTFGEIGIAYCEICGVWSVL